MIQGQKINLRTVRERDLDQLFDFYSDIQECGPYWPVELRSEVEFRAEFNKHGFWQKQNGTLLITNKTDHMVGMLAFFPLNHYLSGVEIGYSIFRGDERGQGYMTEAALLFCAYLFSLKPIPRIVAHIDVDNAPSRIVAEKTGFVKEGTLKQAYFIHGSYRSMDVYTLFRETCVDFQTLIHPPHSDARN